MSQSAVTSLSVIVPTYNCAPYLAAALDSLLRQTRPPDEIIVVDDGSTDGTAGVLEAYTNCVRVIWQPNRGVSAARNAGLNAARMRYVGLLDADDICEPNRFERQLPALAAHPEAAACFTGHYVFDEDGGRTEYAPAAGAAEASPLAQAGRCLVFPPTLVFDRERGADVTYPPGVTCGEDVLFVAQLRRRGGFVVIAEPLYGYRRRAGQATSRYSVVDGFEQRRRWIAEHWPATLDGEPVADRLWQEFALTARDFYWARDRTRFELVRDYIRRHGPDGLRPPELDWRWHPDWLWGVKERVARLRRRR